MTPASRLGLILASFVLCASCGENDAIQLGSVHLESVLISAAGGGSFEVTAAEDPALAGAGIHIPPSALIVDTRITLGAGPDSILDEESDVAGPVVELGPEGTRFTLPVRVTIPYPGPFDEDLVRVYAQDSSGAVNVLLPDQIHHDPVARTLRFEVRQLSRFQGARSRGACRHVAMCPGGSCRRGQCLPPPPCEAADCGTPMRVARQMCADGTTSGPTGRCLRQGDGACGWEVRSCPEPVRCDPSECGPRPGIPNTMCRDGTVGGPTGHCLRAMMGGACGWEIRMCGA